MDKDDRLSLIRRGNELYNRGDFKSALKLFLYTNYQDGIVRVADHLYYDEKDQIGAIKLYKKAGYQRRVDEFAEKAAMTIQLWLQEDEAVQKEEITVPQEALENNDEKLEEKKERFKKWKPKTIKTDDLKKAGLEKGNTSRVFEQKDLSEE